MSTAEKPPVWKKSARLAIKLAISTLTLVYAARSIDWSSLGGALQRMELATGAIVLSMLCANLLVTSTRFGQVLRAFRFEVPSGELFRTHVYSQLSGLVFFQIVGQTISRAVMLRRWRVDEASAIIATLVERAIVLAVSLALCAAGAVGVLGLMSPAIDAQFVSYGAKALVVLLLALAAGGLLAFPTYANGWANSLLSALRMHHLATACGAAVVAQLLVAFCYVVIAKSAAPDADTTTLLAAALVVMFAASIPISVGGWGVRELSAVWVFRQAGLPDEVALMTAIAIGGFSLLVVLAPLPFLAFSPRPVGAPEASPTGCRLPGQDARATWFVAVPLLAAILIFFQVKIPFGGREIVLNLADPAALVGGLYCVWHLVRQRSLPRWSSRHLNLAIGTFTAALTLALFVGYLSFGPTPWAINNRYAGWLVLLLYMLAGSLAVGLDPTRRLFSAVAKALLVGAATVSLAEIVLLSMKSVGLIDAGSPLTGYNIEGFALNRNAFAFQLLVVAGLATACLNRTERQRLGFVSMLFVLSAAVLSGSRSAWLTLPLMAVIALRLRLATPRELATLALAVAAVVALPHVLGSTADTGGNPARLMIQRPLSDDERMAANVEAVALWLKAPVLGSGLGAFIHDWSTPHRNPLVIHNIYLWLLAETGIIGLTALLALFWTAYRHRDDGTSDPQRRNALLLILACMAMSGLFHDMLYQRVFWFAFGALAAAPACWIKPSSPRLNSG